MKRKPMVTPVANSLQNQIANLAPARMAKPTTIGAIKAANPISGLGNPKRRAWAVSITDLHEMNGFRSQLRVAPGFVATWIRSSVRVKAAIQPRIPVRIRTQANLFDGLGNDSVKEGFTSVMIQVCHLLSRSLHANRGAVVGDILCG